MIEVALGPLPPLSPSTPLRQHTLSLCSHLAHCPAIGSIGLRARCLVEAVHGAIAPRLFTTVVLACAALAAVLVVAGVTG